MVTIRALEPTDWPAIHRIYEEGIATGLATLATRAPDWLAWDAAHLPVARLAAEDEGTVIGWTAVSPISSKCEYEGAVELSIYVASDARGKRVGHELLEALIEATEAAGFWTLEAQVLEHNEVSIHLCESVGFRIVGLRERIGRLDGQWHNVVLLERRSEIVGVEEPEDGTAG